MNQEPDQFDPRLFPGGTCLVQPQAKLATAFTTTAMAIVLCGQTQLSFEQDTPRCFPGQLAMSQTDLIHVFSQVVHVPKI